MVFTLDKLEINVMTGTLGWGRNWGELGQEGQMSPIWAGTRVSEDFTGHLEPTQPAPHLPTPSTGHNSKEAFPHSVPTVFKAYLGERGAPRLLPTLCSLQGSGTQSD